VTSRGQLLKFVEYLKQDTLMYRWVGNRPQ